MKEELMEFLDHLSRDVLKLNLAHSMQQLIRIQPLCDDLHMPDYATSGSSGVDVYSRDAEAYEQDERGQERGFVTIFPGAVHIFSLGFTAELPKETEWQVRSKSGIARRNLLVVLNQPGTIDEDYAHEIAVMLINLGTVAVKVYQGQKIAQLVCCPVLRPMLVTSPRHRETQRTGGFGSTGLYQAAQ